MENFIFCAVIHHCNLQKLTVDIFNFKLDTAPALSNTIFQITENTYALEKKKDLKLEMSTRYVMVLKLPQL